MERKLKEIRKIKRNEKKSNDRGMEEKQLKKYITKRGLNKTRLKEKNKNKNREVKKRELN